MEITVAGKKKSYAAPLTVAQLIAAEEIENPLYVTVTINEEFLPAGQIPVKELRDGDNVEFLYFMGGGAFTDEELERYSRHILLKEIGVKGQRKLQNARVLIIGAGGLGAPAALYLAAAGVGVIGVADADTVELSNLQRQVIHSANDLGKPKVLSAKESMEAINPHVRVNACQEYVCAENIAALIRDYDFVLDGTDNFPAKFLINDACVMAQKPFSHAGILRFGGQLMTYVPGAGPCYRCAFKEPPPPDAVPTCREAGVVGAMGGVIGSLQAMEAVKFITGAGKLLTGSLLTFDALTMEFRKVRLPRNPRCAVCGEAPVITKLTDYVQPVCALKR
ncbi:MAG: sulfur carrier protein ThiS [Oscillospiraceae bacterium]|jgi:thiamine biosynthesis protein ThiS|nr:sulfur carrier protein ThiS [Oscillospiraceae bacterium]